MIINPWLLLLFKCIGVMIATLVIIQLVKKTAQPNDAKQHKLYTIAWAIASIFSILIIVGNMWRNYYVSGLNTILGLIAGIGISRCIDFFKHRSKDRNQKEHGIRTNSRD